MYYSNEKAQRLHGEELLFLELHRRNVQGPKSFGNFKILSPSFDGLALLLERIFQCIILKIVDGYLDFVAGTGYRED